MILLSFDKPFLVITDFGEAKSLSFSLSASGSESASYRNRFTPMAGLTDKLDRFTIHIKLLMSEVFQHHFDPDSDSDSDPDELLPKKRYKQKIFSYRYVS